jgi:thioredoxin reductase (NADPH)
LQALKFADGQTLPLDALFTTRGDVFYNHLAKMLGAKIVDGAIVVTPTMQTTVTNLYAAGCVTPANCQMITAAGQGAAAAQAINRRLFEESLTAQVGPKRCSGTHRSIHRHRQLHAKKVGAKPRG